MIKTSARHDDEGSQQNTNTKTSSSLLTHKTGMNSAFSKVGNTTMPRQTSCEKKLDHNVISLTRCIGRTTDRASKQIVPKKSFSDNNHAATSKTVPNFSKPTQSFLNSSRKNPTTSTVSDTQPCTKARFPKACPVQKDVSSKYPCPQTKETANRMPSRITRDFQSYAEASSSLRKPTASLRAYQEAVKGKEKVGGKVNSLPRLLVKSGNRLTSSAVSTQKVSSKVYSRVHTASMDNVQGKIGKLGITCTNTNRITETGTHCNPQSLAVGPRRVLHNSSTRLISKNTVVKASLKVSVSSDQQALRTNASIIPRYSRSDNVGTSALNKSYSTLPMMPRLKSSSKNVKEIKRDRVRFQTDIKNGKYSVLQKTQESSRAPKVVLPVLATNTMDTVSAPGSQKCPSLYLNELCEGDNHKEATAVPLIPLRDKKESTQNECMNPRGSRIADEINTVSETDSSVQNSTSTLTTVPHIQCSETHSVNFMQTPEFTDVENAITEYSTTSTDVKEGDVQEKEGLTKKDIRSSCRPVNCHGYNLSFDTQVYDSHCDIGDWMVLVDLAVAEKALQDENNTECEPLTAAARSLASLSLLAARAADCVAGSSIQPEDPLDDIAECLGNTAVHRISRSLSPPRPNATPPRSARVNVNGGALCTTETKVENQEYPRRRCSSTCSALATPCNTPTPQVPESTKTVDTHTRYTKGSFRDRAEASRGSLRSSGSASLLLRAPKRHVARGRSRLLREDVMNAISVHGADPNEYFFMPITHIPWTASAPVLWRDTTNSAPRRSGKMMPTSPCRLHVLHIASTLSSPAVVRTLISLGACPNALDCWHRNPLHVLLQPPPICSCLQGCLESGKQHELSQEETYACYKLCMFFLKQIVPRSTTETQIAEILCDAGINVTFQDIWGKNCVDYATTWIKIRRLASGGVLGSSFVSIIKQKTEYQESCPHRCIENFVSKDDSLHIVRPLMTASVEAVQKHLLYRMPHALLDVVLLHEDRLRLQALSSIVGVHAGGEKLPTEMVRIYPRKRISQQHPELRIAFERDSSNYVTPKRGQHFMSNGLDRDRLLSSSNSTEQCLKRGSTLAHCYDLGTNSSVTLSHVRGTAPRDSVGSVTGQRSWGAIDLTLSCLRALEKDFETTDTINTPADELSPHIEKDQDLVEFLRLLSAPSYRFHPAFAGIWEYLGATVFPKAKVSPEVSSPLTDVVPKEHSFLSSNLNLSTFRAHGYDASDHTTSDSATTSTQLPAFHLETLSPLPLSTAIE